MILKYQATASCAAVPEWILPPLSCAFLESVAAVLPAPLNAFEFGSGRSTHALRRVSSQTTSVENSAEWLERTENGESARRATDYSAVVPLQHCWNRTRLIESFDVESRPEVLSRLRQSHLIRWIARLIRRSGSMHFSWPCVTRRSMRSLCWTTWKFALFRVLPAVWRSKMPRVSASGS